MREERDQDLGVDYDEKMSYSRVIRTKPSSLPTSTSTKRPAERKFVSSRLASLMQPTTPPDSEPAAKDTPKESKRFLHAAATASSEKTLHDALEWLAGLVGWSRDARCSAGGAAPPALRTGMAERESQKEFLENVSVFHVRPPCGAACAVTAHDSARLVHGGCAKWRMRRCCAVYVSFGARLAWCRTQCKEKFVFSYRLGIDANSKYCIL